MGSVSRPEGSFPSEIRSRAAQAHAALAKLEPRVHRSPLISQPAKRVLNNAVVTSRLLFNVGTWPLMDNNTVNTSVVTVLAVMSIKHMFSSEIGGISKLSRRHFVVHHQNPEFQHRRLRVEERHRPCLQHGSELVGFGLRTKCALIYNRRGKLCFRVS